MNEREMLDRAMGLIREQLEQGGPFSLLRFRMGELLVDYEDAPREPQPTPNLVTREELAPVMDALEALTEKAIEGDPDLLFKWLAVREFASGLRHCKNARGEGE